MSPAVDSDTHGTDIELDALKHSVLNVLQDEILVSLTRDTHLYHQGAHLPLNCWHYSDLSYLQGQAGEMVQWLRVPAVCREPGFGSQHPHEDSKLSVTQPQCLLDPMYHGYPCDLHTYMQAKHKIHSKIQVNL